MPAKALRPVPNRLSASPVAYWLVFKKITSRPNISAMPAPAAAPPTRGFLGRMRDAIGAVVNRMARPTPQRIDLEKNPALRFVAIQSSPQLRAGFAKACEERFCKEELVALDAAESFLAQPDRHTFAAMAFVASKVNLPDDLLTRIERQCPAEGPLPPFDPRAATRLARDIQTNLKSLLSDNIVQDPKLRGKHGLDDATLLAQLRKTPLATA